MKTITIAARYRSSLCAAALMLAACSTGGTSATPSAVNALVPVNTPRQLAVAQHPNHAKSWMIKQPKGTEYLYVGGAGEDDVYVYNYKTHALVGTLTGFDDPAGECVDARGHVWITNYLGTTIGGVCARRHDPINTLQTPMYTIGCSVSPNGDLAASVYQGPSYSPGEILIWSNASGTPTSYQNPYDCEYLEPPGYDNNGNLWVETFSQSAVNVCELQGGSSGTGLSLVQPPSNVHINAPGSAMWDGKYITLTDPGYQNTETAIHQAALNGKGHFKQKGETILTDDCEGSFADVFQPYIVGKTNTPNTTSQGKRVLGGDADCVGSQGGLSLWHYPAGGADTGHWQVGVTSGSDGIDSSGLSVSFKP